MLTTKHLLSPWENKKKKDKSKFFENSKPYL